MRQGPLRLRLRPPSRSPDRAADPQGRRPKRADVAIDPANPWTHFREATWEEALDARRRRPDAASATRDGGKALAGFGSAKGSNEEAYLFQKLVRTGFGTNNVDHCTRLCHASSVAALMEGDRLGRGDGAVHGVPPTPTCIIVIGANPTENHPVAATFIKNAAKRGAKLIVMDPRGQALSAPRHHHAAVQARARDVAMLNALMHMIIEEGLYDRQYVAGSHRGLRRAARARSRTSRPEAMAPVCGIDAATLREVARIYARSRASIIFWGMGISQHVHGTDNARCLIALALITGQVGRPGTGLHPLRGQNNVQGASDAGLIPMVYPDYQSVDDAGVRGKFEDALGHDARPQARA